MRVNQKSVPREESMTLKSRHFSAILGVDEREHGWVRLGPVLRDPRRRRVRRRAELEQLDDLDPGLQAAGGDAANAPKCELYEKPIKIGDVLNTSPFFQETIQFLHLSDIHIDLFYNTSAAGSDCGQPLCCREENGIVGANSSGYWGDRECGLPIWSFRDMTPPFDTSHLRS